MTGTRSAVDRAIVIATLLLCACATSSGCERSSATSRRAGAPSQPAGTESVETASRGHADAGAETADVASDRDAEPSLSVAVVSDLNGSYGSTEHGDLVHVAVRRIVELRPDLVISLGDMVAGQRPGLDYRAMWQGFHRAVSEPLRGAGIPLAVTPGNHDGSGYAEYAEERAVFVSEWTRRRPSVRFVDDSQYPLRYSFVAGPAFFVALDATMVGPLPDDQREWLESQLERGSSSAAVIVFGHLPLHPVAVGRETEHLDDPALEALLVRQGVDLYLSGHHHAFYPAKRGSLRMVAVGCLGSGARPLIGGSSPSPKTLVMVRVTSSGVVSVEAFSGPRLDDPVDWSSLPESLGSGVHVLRRADRD